MCVPGSLFVFTICVQCTQMSHSQTPKKNNFKVMLRLLDEPLFAFFYIVFVNTQVPLEKDICARAQMVNTNSFYHKNLGWF